MTVEETVKTKVKDNKERERRQNKIIEEQKKTRKQILATQISEHGVTKNTKV